MDQWKSGWETKERGSLAKKEKEQHSGSILKIKEKKEKLGEERKNHVEGLQGKKMRGGGGEKKTGAGKKLSWADGQGPWKEERKKERKGRSVPKSENFVKKAEHSGGEDKSEKLSSKAEYSAEEDDLTKELLSLLAPPPKIQIPESLDPSKVKLFCI